MSEDEEELEDFSASKNSGLNCQRSWPKGKCPTAE
jgi:hypothetical protein